MKIIADIKELRKLLGKNRNLTLRDDDVRIEFQVEKGVINNIFCKDLFLDKDGVRFDFYGGDFRGGDFRGRDFIGRDFSGWNFTGRDFIGRNFIGENFFGRNFFGRNFFGRNVSYSKGFYCVGKISYIKIAGRGKDYTKPFSLSRIIEMR